MKKIIILFLSINLFFPVFSQTTESGDIFTKVSNIISSMPGDGTDEYSAPSAAELTIFQNIIADFIAGNYADADTKAATVGYDVIEFTETTIVPNPIYYVLEKTAASTNHWGTYIFNPSPCRAGLTLQSPHSKKDFNTGKESIHIFRKLEAEFFFLNGTSRCNDSSYSSCSGTTSICGSSESYRISDLAHVTDAVFHSLTKYIFDNVANSHFVQLHGFTKQASDPYVIMSNGTDIAPTGTDHLPNLKTHLFNADNTLTFKIAHIDSWTRLIGTTNTQGRYINSSTNDCSTNATAASGRFLHLEQEKTKLRDDITGWDKMAFGLAQTFPGSGCTFLPVEFIGFNLLKNKNHILIEWETASEDNLDYFEIEHSNDGILFNSIYSTNAKNTPYHYSFEDRNPLIGKNYYRIKSIDKDGSYAYSKIKSIDWKNNTAISIFPTPTRDKLFFESDMEIDEILIFDLMQNNVLNQKANIQNELNIKSLFPGVYIISFLSRNKTYNYRIIKI